MTRSRLPGVAGCCALIALALAGCTSVPQASPERDAEAKAFITHPRASTLYVYRPDFSSHEMDDPALYVDSRLIGTTVPGAYFRIDVRPGAHVLHGIASDNGMLKLETRPGEIHFVSLVYAAGQSHFARVDAAAGKRELARCCVLFENWTPGQRPLLR